MVRSTSVDGTGDIGFGIVLGLVVATVVIALFRLYPRSWKISPRYQAPAAFVLLLLFTTTSGLVGHETALMAAAAAVALATPLVARRARRARTIDRAIRDLTVPERREEALAVLVAQVGPPPMRMRDWSSWSKIVLFVAAHVARAGLPREALSLVDRIDRALLDPYTTGVRAQIVAACCVPLGERERARRELTTVARPARDALFERAIVATEILLDALDGAPTAEARARSSLAAERDPHVGSTLRAALAHALAASGQRDEAVAELRKLAAETPPPPKDGLPLQPVLERVARQRGPASPLAEAILGGQSTPYRSV